MCQIGMTFAAAIFENFVALSSCFFALRHLSIDLAFQVECPKKDTSVKFFLLHLPKTVSPSKNNSVYEAT